MSKRTTHTNNRANQMCSDSWFDKLLHPFLWLKVRMAEKWRDLRFRCQRFKKGYSDYDVWSMNDWFVRTVKPMLQQMHDKAYNYPDTVTEEQWRGILGEMVCLLEIMDAWDDTAARKQAGVVPEDNSQGAIQLISAEKEKAKCRFFFLFNKWFYDLWY